LHPPLPSFALCTVALYEVTAMWINYVCMYVGVCTYIVLQGCQSDSSTKSGEMDCMYINPLLRTAGLGCAETMARLSTLERRQSAWPRTPEVLGAMP